MCGEGRASSRPRADLALFLDSVGSAALAVEVVLERVVKHFVAAGSGVVACEVPVADGRLVGWSVGRMVGWSVGRMVGWGYAPPEVFDCLENDFDFGLHPGRGQQPRDFGAVLLVREAGVKRHEWIGNAGRRSKV